MQSPDIVHTYLPAANVLGTVAARWAGIHRVVVSKRSLSDYKKGHPFLKRLESWGNRLSDVVMVNSDAVRREIERTERHWKGSSDGSTTGSVPSTPWTPEQVESFRDARGTSPPGSRGGVRLQLLRLQGARRSRGGGGEDRREISPTRPSC